ncbi:MAG: helix-turn-helix domain-containing protein [Flavobacteriales bacterium]
MAYGYFPMPLPPEQLAPDSYIKLALILEGTPLYFDGTGALMDWHDGFCGHVPPSKGIITYSEGPVRCVMVNFYPSGFHQLFGLPVDRFTGRMVPPREVLGRRIETLYAELRATKEPSDLFPVIEQCLLELLADWPTPPPTAMQLVEQRIRESKGTLATKDLAALVGLSERQLQRKALTELGLSLKAFSSVVRFNHVYSHMQRTRKLDLDVALACGFFDEAHMMKEMKRYLGKTPKRFVGMVRPMVDANLGH